MPQKMPGIINASPHQLSPKFQCNFLPNLRLCHFCLVESGEQGSPSEGEDKRAKIGRKKKPIKDGANPTKCVTFMRSMVIKPDLD
jgi:hypothetical protein